MSHYSAAQKTMSVFDSSVPLRVDVSSVTYQPPIFINDFCGEIAMLHLVETHQQGG